jgi:hypothetical protein
VKNKNDFYSSSSIGEPSLRDEFNNTIYGSFQEVAKGQTGLLRRFRKTDGEFVACPCVDSVTGEPDRESRCPVCLGEAKLWDEESLDFYHIRANTESANTQQDKIHAPGIENTETEVFYIPSSFSLTKHDKIVVLTLDKEGLPVTPLERFQLFRISELRPMRLDNGRLEFWKAFCYEDNSKFL